MSGTLKSARLNHVLSSDLSKYFCFYFKIKMMMEEKQSPLRPRESVVTVASFSVQTITSIFISERIQVKDLFLKKHVLAKMIMCCCVVQMA